MSNRERKIIFEREREIDMSNRERKIIFESKREREKN